MALFAVVAHFVDVVTAGGVGFTSDKAVVSKLTHSSGVGQLDPFYCVAVDT